VRATCNVENRHAATARPGVEQATIRLQLASPTPHALCPTSTTWVALDNNVSIIILLKLTDIDVVNSGRRDS